MIDESSDCCECSGDYLEMFLAVDRRRDARELPHALGHLQAELIQGEVKQVRRLEVRTVVKIVGALRVFLQPRALVSRVIQHDVTYTQHL